MKREPRLRAERIWITAVLVILVLSVWWFPGEGARLADTFTAQAGGKKAFYTLVEHLHPKVFRHLEGPFPWGRMDTLCIVGPARYPSAREWAAIHDWVERGNSLLFAARFDDPVVDLSPFAARVRPAASLLANRRETDDESDGEGRETDDFDLESPFEERADTDLVDGAFEWRSQGFLLDVAGNAEILVRAGEQPQVFSLQVGQGRLVLASSDYIFSNRAMVEADNGLLAHRILECCESEGSVCFDESLNASGAARDISLLLAPPFRRVSLQLLLVAVLFGWWGCRRFGPPRPPSEPPRRSIAEHAEALGNLYFKAEAGERAVASYLEHFLSEWRGGTVTKQSAPAEAAIARRTGVDEKEVAELLRSAHQLAREKRVAPARAATIVRRLALLGRRLRSSAPLASRSSPEGRKTHKQEKTVKEETHGN